MYQANPIMIQAGYVPAARVAEVLNKAVSTVHRMVADGRIEGARDGRALYVSVKSLENYFKSSDNAAMIEAIRKELKGVVAPQ